ncbi:glycosyltransferase, partial [Patescibacteria group bacterium]|nr:glycosyltransferase [Patescibacteria group bacterium]
CYLTIDECVKKIRYYLDHPAERQSLAAAGMARARRDHTWEKRLAVAFNALGLLVS